jgi:hypothetical protein
MVIIGRLVWNPGYIRIQGDIGRISATSTTGNMSTRSEGSWWASTADSDSTAARAPSDTELPAPRVSTGKPVASPAERCWRLRRLHTLGKKVPFGYAVLFGGSTGHRCSSDMLLNRTASALLRCLHLPHSHPVAQRLDPDGLALSFLLRLLESDAVVAGCHRPVRHVCIVRFRLQHLVGLCLSGDARDVWKIAGVDGCALQKAVVHCLEGRVSYICGPQAGSPTTKY